MKLIKVLYRSLRNESGAALLTVFVVIMVLLTLGMGLMALTVGNAQQAKVDDTYEKAYYVAEGGAQQGEAFVRKSVADIYASIKSDVQTNGVVTASNTSTFFFQQLKDKADSFTCITPNTSAQAGVTGLVVTIADNTGSGETRDITITSTAMNGSASARIVSDKITIHFVPISVSYVSFRKEAMVTLGTFTETPQAQKNFTITGDVVANSYSLPGTPPDITGKKLTLADVPSASTDAFTWNINYAKRLALNPMDTNNIDFKKVINSSGTVSGLDPFNWNAPDSSWFPMRITRSGDISFSSNLNAYLKNTNGMQIDSAGNITIDNPISGTPSNYIKIYCNGNFTTTTNGALSYVKVYCSGSKLSIGTDCTNVELNCANNVYVSSTELNGTNKIYSGGSVEFTSGDAYGTLVLYAENSIYFHNSGQFGTSSKPLSGIIYTNGTFKTENITYEFSGQLAAKTSMKFDSANSFHYTNNSTLVQSLVGDSFVTDGTIPKIVVPSISSVITGTNISEQ